MIMNSECKSLWQHYAPQKKPKRIWGGTAAYHNCDHKVLQMVMMDCIQSCYNQQQYNSYFIHHLGFFTSCLYNKYTFYTYCSKTKTKISSSVSFSSLLLHDHVFQGKVVCMLLSLIIHDKYCSRMLLLSTIMWWSDVSLWLPPLH